jgi:hypothetical protein
LGGLAALFVARPLFPSESAAAQGDGLLAVMLWIALGALWLLSSVLGRGQLRFRFGWTDAAVVLLVTWHTVAAIWAATHASPRPAVNMLWVWIALGLSFLLARQLIVTDREARAVMAVMVGLAVALSGYGLYQYYHEMPMARAEFKEDSKKVLREAELSLEPGSRQHELFRIRLESPEPYATFALANSLAGYLAPWMIVAAGIAVTTLRGNRRSPIGPRAAACAVVIGVCLILTKSRSAYVAAALGLLLVGVFCRQGKTRLGWKLPTAMAASAAILVAAAFVFGPLDVQVLSEAPKSLGYRLQYWQATREMIADHPLVGCGPGNFQAVYTQYKLPEASEEVADPHNFLLEVWATAGTPSLLALLAVLGGFAFTLARRRDPSRQPRPGDPSDGPASVADASDYVLGGAAAGVLLSVPMGGITSSPPSLAAVGLGGPLAALTVFVLLRWVRTGPRPIVLAVIGLVVLLVNLLAAGGIGYPGVAGTLWLLMAIALNVSDTSAPPALPRNAGLVALAVALAAAVACSVTAFRPVLECREKMDLAERNAKRNPSLAHQYLSEAAAADPLAAEPLRHLAELKLRDWLRLATPQEPHDELFGRFEAFMQSAADRAPNAAATWRTWGDQYWKAFQHIGRRDYAQKATWAYLQAVDRYPNNGRLRASLALALRAAGDEAGFRREAQKALRLDRLTDHADQKIDDVLREELRRRLTRSGSRQE